MCRPDDFIHLDNDSEFSSLMQRTVTLFGAIEGTLWMPAGTAQKPIQADLTRIASTYISATGSGLVEAARSLCDDGDFQSARLTGDSVIVIEHRVPSPHGWVAHVRVVDVTALPSLADYVSANALTVPGWPE